MFESWLAERSIIVIGSDEILSLLVIKEYICIFIAFLSESIKRKNDIVVNPRKQDF
jgi:hypothetical protein